MEIITKRFVAFTKDEKEILTQGGFKPVANVRGANPRLFANIGCLREAVSFSYGEEAIQNIIIKKVEVTYKYED